MWKKIAVAVLGLSVLGAAGVAIWDNRSSLDAAVAHAQEVATSTVTAPTPAAGAAPVVAAFAATIGSPWSASGAIVALDDTGMRVQLADGAEVYVELGRPDYWQAQGVPLANGDIVDIVGFSNGDQTHAATVTTASGAQLAVRSVTGQPLWSGSQGQTEAGAHTAENTQQTSIETWQTITGTISAIARNGFTLQRSDGTFLLLQLGRSDFWQSQAIEFAAGDEITVLGFEQGDQFQVAQITHLATGDRLLLRDPNGRPLWGGPGRNGNGGQGRTQPGTLADGTTTLPEAQDQ